MSRIKPIKSLGQNFLEDTSIAEKIVEALDIKPGDKILEIGPGPGVLTSILLKYDIHLSAVEIDKRAYNFLCKKYQNEISEGKLELINQDFLKYEIENHDLKVIGNIPYYISNEIMFKLLENSTKITRAVITVQKEVAERFAAKAGKKQYGITSIAIQYYGEAQKLFDIPAEAFFPPPKVISSVVKIDFHNKKYEVEFSELQKLTKLAFNQRRKKLSNSVSEIFSKIDVDDRIESFRDKRAEQLTLDDYFYLYRKLKEKN